MASSDSSDYLLERLHGLVMRRWWWRTLGLWLTVGVISLLALRQEFLILQQHFTWTAFRYALAYHRLAALGLGLCVGLTVALLVGESRHILFGLSDSEKQQLQRLCHHIEQRGQGHPFWKALHRRKP
jgi:hypothetical protein